MLHVSVMIHKKLAAILTSAVEVTHFQDDCYTHCKLTCCYMLHSNLKMTALTIIIDHFDNIIDRMYYLLLYSQKIYIYMFSVPFQSISIIF